MRKRTAPHWQPPVISVAHVLSSGGQLFGVVVGMLVGDQRGEEAAPTR